MIFPVYFVFLLLSHLLTLLPSTSPTPVNTTIWQPRVGTTWQIELPEKLTDSMLNVEVYDIDLFINHKPTIDTLHAKNRKVICYFSAGTYEPYRCDHRRFHEEDMGKNLTNADWHTERWLNINSPNVRSIMSSRLDLAAYNGCDGVDPDNVDGYNNDNGLGLTEKDSVEYVLWLAKEASSRGLAIGLKNAGEIISQTIDHMQWSVNEQCAQKHECQMFAPFVEQGKPVFHIEYPKGEDVADENPVDDEKKKQACEFENSGLFSTVMKNMKLDKWLQNC
ncbi:endo alpha-1,4 polygalactosaminidase [Aspergillus heteromorphus CBS 117.55]|uniref:alpha-galactosidase n=1 Tax=Aspergillus heteromorphus CBS 117.55 TaxID=1448321 RepID=A0A317VWH8_9EURO|nr:endo alpha-1,4 polygalactosaminidase [Aspergillus heteromorphus CBS 117.55]PWY77367.1 endo alpha-1,4 polygalactosaminidase [Aspergillus heteromorphus CBS 117.55]